MNYTPMIFFWLPNVSEDSESDIKPPKYQKRNVIKSDSGNKLNKE